MRHAVAAAIFCASSLAGAAEFPATIPLSSVRVEALFTCSSPTSEEITVSGGGQVLHVIAGKESLGEVSAEEVQWLVIALIDSTFPYLPERVIPSSYIPNDKGSLERLEVEVRTECSVALTLVAAGISKKVFYVAASLAPQDAITRLREISDKVERPN